MKKLLCIMIIVSCSLFAKWHPCTAPPKIDQLFMKEEPVLPKEKLLGKILVISYFNGEKICRFNMHNGWWDVTKEDLWEWIHGEFSIVYCPKYKCENI